jgi:hypothetical protein
MGTLSKRTAHAYQASGAGAPLFDGLPMSPSTDSSRPGTTSRVRHRVWQSELGGTWRLMDVSALSQVVPGSRSISKVTWCCDRKGSPARDARHGSPKLFEQGTPSRVVASPGYIQYAGEAPPCDAPHGLNGVGGAPSTGRRELSGKPFRPQHLRLVKPRALVERRSTAHRRVPPA